MDAARIKPGERNTRKLLAAMAAVVAAGIHVGHFFRGAGNQHGFSRSARKPSEIVGELKAFYSRRPRPWRWHGNQSKRTHLQKGRRTWRRSTK